MTHINGRYLAAIRQQIEHSLWPEEDKASQQVATYISKIIAYLVAQHHTMPGLHDGAMEDYKAILPGICSGLVDEPELIQLLEQTLLHKPDYDQAVEAVQRAVSHLLSVDSMSNKKIVHQIIEIGLKVEVGLEQALVDELKRDVSSTKDRSQALQSEQKQRLQTFLREKFPFESALQIGSVKLIPGGYSKLTYFIDLQNCKSLPETIVIRMDKSDSPMGTTVSDEFEIIQTMYDAGVPVPKPFLIETDSKILGASFLIVSRVEGDVIGDFLDVVNPSISFGVSLAHGLAKMHGVPPEKLGKAVPGANVSIEKKMWNDISDYESKWRSLGEKSVALETAFSWLKKNIHLAEGPRAAIHRDIGCHNLLVKDGQLSAILDWESVAIGNPAQDIGYAKDTVCQVMNWQDFLEEYGHAGGNIPSEEQIEYFQVWRAAWLITMELEAKAVLRAGLSSDIGLTYAVTYNFQRLSTILQRLLYQVTA